MRGFNLQFAEGEKTDMKRSITMGVASVAGKNRKEMTKLYGKARTGTHIYLLIVKFVRDSQVSGIGPSVFTTRLGIHPVVLRWNQK